MIDRLPPGPAGCSLRHQPALARSRRKNPTAGRSPRNWRPMSVAATHSYRERLSSVLLRSQALGLKWCGRSSGAVTVSGGTRGRRSASAWRGTPDSGTVRLRIPQRPPGDDARIHGVQPDLHRADAEGGCAGKGPDAADASNLYWQNTDASHRIHAFTYTVHAPSPTGRRPAFIVAGIPECVSPRPIHRLWRRTIVR